MASLSACVYIAPSVSLTHSLAARNLAKQYTVVITFPNVVTYIFYFNNREHT